MNSRDKVATQTFQSSFAQALAGHQPAQAFYFQPGSSQEYHSSSSDHFDKRSLSQRDYSVDDELARDEKLDLGMGLWWKGSPLKSRGLATVIHEEERKGASNKIRLFEKVKRNKDQDEDGDNYDKMSTKSQDEIRIWERKLIQNMEFVGMNHDSQFFKLKDTSLPSLPQHQAKTILKKRNNYNNRKIPTLQEWFKSLSIEDRVLCVSSISKRTVDSVVRMHKKVSKHGPGKFTLKTRILTKKRMEEEKEEPAKHYMQQDFCFTSLKELCKIDRCSLAENHSMQQKLFSENEFLSFVRITQTFEPNDTLTVMPELVHDTEKFLDLLQTICGSIFIIPPETSVLTDKDCLKSSMPLWFSPQELQSLAQWVIFYLERTMWIQYKIYVKGELLAQFEQCKKNFLVDPEGTLVRTRAELMPFWKSYHQKLKKDSQLSEELETELINYIFENRKQDVTLGASINNLTGGLKTLENRDPHNFENNRSILMILQKQADPETFISNLGLLNLEDFGSYNHFELQKMFIEVLRKKYREDLDRQAHPNWKRNQKKKAKKKQKQKMKEEKKDKFPQEEKCDEQEKDTPKCDREEPKVADLGPVEEMDYFSNQMILLNENYSQNLSSLPQRGPREEISEQEQLATLYRQLLGSPTPAKEIPVPQAVVVDAIVLVRPVFFQVNIVMEEVTGEALKDDDSSKQVDTSEQSESTDDQIECCLRRKNDSKEQLQEGVALEQINIENLENENPNHDDFNLASEKFELKEHNFQSEKKKKKKPKMKQSYQNSQQDKEEKQQMDYGTGSFFIIRSQKGFNTGTNPSTIQTQVKKKKKKRTKPILFNQWSSQDQSSKLNSFMRNIVSPQEDEALAKVKEKAILAKQATENQKKKAYQPKSKIVEESKTFESDGQMGDSIWQNSEDQALLLGVQLSRKHNRQHSQEKLPQKEAPIFCNSFQKRDQYSNKFESFLCEQNSQSIYSFRSNEDEIQFGGNTKNSAAATGDFSKKSKWPQAAQKPTKTKGKKKAAKATAPGDLSSLNFMKRNSMQNQLGYMANYNLDPYNRQKPPTLDQFGESFSFYPQMPHSPPQLDINHLHQMISEALLQKHHSQTPAPYEMSFAPAAWEGQEQVFGVEQERFLDERVELFFELVESEMIRFEKENEKKLNSVRKEREQVISIIQEHIQKTYNAPSFPTAQAKKGYQKNFVSIKMYGSMASGLAIDSSDVDIAVTGLSFKGSHDSHIREMKALQESLAILSNSFTMVKFIESATIPVIKLQIDLQKMRQKIIQQEVARFGKTNTPATIDQDMRLLGMDITFEDLGAQTYGQATKVNLGIECVNYISTQCMQLKDLKPIVLILKKLLQSKNLNQPYLGGLSSYSLVLMTATFLKSQNTNSMSKNLTEFLNYYGNFFNPFMTQLDGENFYPVYDIPSDPLIVNDPLNQHNNTTRNAFRVQEVLTLFKKAHLVIVKSLEEFQQAEDCDVKVIDKIIAGKVDF